ncbi:MAG: ferritin family protein [Thermoleophilia bacterium]|nr:ferritin family protein [Thermoleophilia bacterium]
MSDEQTDLNNLREDLKDELLAINHYQVHIDATDNPDIQKLLGHIRDEEKEHVAELVKLIRQLDPTEDELFKKEGL